MTAAVQQGEAADVPEEISGRMISFLFLSVRPRSTCCTITYAMIICHIFTVQCRHSRHSLNTFLCSYAAHKSFIYHLVRYSPQFSFATDVATIYKRK